LKSADRDLQRSIPVQIVARNREGDRMSGPFRGRPVEVRNGLPVGRFYVYKGTGKDQLKAYHYKLEGGGVGSEQREQLREQ
jgi:hypothetical protein